MYSVLLNKQSSKYYERLSDNTAVKVNKAIEKICNNPFRVNFVNDKQHCLFRDNLSSSRREAIVK